MAVKKLNRNLIETLDKSGMYQMLVDFPGQCQHARSLGKVFRPERQLENVKKIIFAGMGGSAMSGAILQTYLQDKIDLPIRVVQGYSLPSFVDKDSLLFAISYSGNTEELLAVYKEAKKRGVKIIAITSGGKLKALTRKDKNSLIPIPTGFPPRAALGYLVIPALLALEKINLISSQNKYLAESITTLKSSVRKLVIENRKDNLAMEIAKDFYGRIPVIYGSFEVTSAVAYRWRTQLAENSKILSFNHSFPELNHNEIVGWQEQKSLYKNFIITTLRDKEDHPRTKLRMEITRSLLKGCPYKIIEVWSKGKSPLTRIFSLIILGDFVSFYLAILNGVDPTPVERIELLKKRLKNR
ncbi:MAG: bifunctional phosphoglucose/phosphomannose isomerase [Candidatus Ratteibacteria bacterium]|nr:bifunctional phosphoglucose/phosphomannose isomerase [Candidatus Ratteibacteria bacterium]